MHTIQPSVTSQSTMDRFNILRSLKLQDKKKFTKTKSFSAKPRDNKNKIK